MSDLMCPTCNQDTGLRTGWGPDEVSGDVVCPKCGAHIELDWETGFYDAVTDVGSGGYFIATAKSAEQVAKEMAAREQWEASQRHQAEEARYLWPYAAYIDCADTAAAEELRARFNAPSDTPHVVMIEGKPYDVQRGTACLMPGRDGPGVRVAMEVRHSRPANLPGEVSQWSLGG